jgi:hypothetical protein
MPNEQFTNPYTKDSTEFEIKALRESLRQTQSILMSLLKDKTTKDLSKIFNISEKEVRDIKAIVSDI